jgi:hypothetical protein
MSHPSVPIVAYVQSTVPSVQTTSTWTIQTVASNVAVGNVGVIAIDSDGNPHIAYTSFHSTFSTTNENSYYYPLMYASWNGSSWNTQEVTAEGTPEGLALDSHNNPHIIYNGPSMANI